MFNARSYAKANATRSENFLKDHMWRLNWPRKPSREVQKILDIGCGSGDVTVNILAKRLPYDRCDILGVDSNAKRISASAEFIRPNVNFRHLDIADTLPVELPGASFDKIFSFYCLHWVQDQVQALRNMNFLLKPNGEALLAMVSCTDVWDRWRRMAEKSQWKEVSANLDRYIGYYGEVEDPCVLFSSYAATAGFKVRHCENRLGVHRYKSREDRRDIEQALNPMMQHLVDETQKEMYMNEIMEMLEDGNLEEWYSFLIVHLKKEIGAS